jgi:Tfp pilus assembly PilM family ATPase
MLFFDISDTSIELMQLSKTFISGEVINSFSRLEIKDGSIKDCEIQNKEQFQKNIENLLKDAKPKSLKEQECAFILPDNRIYSHRFTVSQKKEDKNILIQIKAQAERTIPQPIDELIYRYKTIGHSKDSSEVLLVALPTKIVNGYIEIFNNLKLTTILISSESLAVHRLISSAINPKEAVLYIDMGGKDSNISIMDKKGVIETFSEPIKDQDNLAHIERVISFSNEKLDEEINRIFLGGGGSSKVDLGKARDVLKKDIVPVETLTANFKPSIKVNLGDTPRTVFTNILGLILLSKEKQPLNLLP